MEYEKINNTPVRKYELNSRPIWVEREGRDRVVAGYDYELTFETPLSCLGDEFRSDRIFTVDLHNGYIFDGYVDQVQVSYVGSFAMATVTVKGGVSINYD